MFFEDAREMGPVTIAKAGDHEPFSWTVRENPDFAKDVGNFARVMRAAERAQILVDNINSRQAAIERSIDDRIAAVRDATGVTLTNYLRKQPTAYERMVNDRFAPPVTTDEPPETGRDAFHRQLRELQDRFPDKSAQIRADVPIENEARNIAFNAERDLEAASATSDMNGIATFGATLAGGALGSFRDPLQVSALVAGGGTSQASSVIARIGYTALREGLINAGVIAATQPAVQAWRREAELRNGIWPAAENVGLALAFGGIIGGGIQGAREASGPAKASIRKVWEGKATEAETRQAVEAVGGKLSPSDDAALRQAGREINEPLTQADLQALRHAEDPVNQPPPDAPLILPERPKDIERVVDESHAVDLGATDKIDGKPVTFERFDPRALSSDAATFQYKGGADAAGVTDRLRGVSEWDATASGKGMVFERKDGGLVVADGHQRLGLARRLLDENPDAKIAIDAFRFRERDGWTAADVRALAAKKNMQEGSGDAIDAARILRERPDLLDGKLPVTAPMMKNAIALSRLSDEAFGMALNGVVPPGYAAAVGSMVRDPLQHAAVMLDLARFKPETEREARLLIGEAMSAGFKTEQQIDLFGMSISARSLMSERVKVLDRALSDLTQNKRLFGTLGQKADAIEAANNQLDRFGNKVKANQAARLADVLTRLAQRTGPVSDALNRAAAQVMQGGKPGAASKRFLDDVEAMLKGDNLDALLAEPKLRPADPIEPASAEALARAETAARDRNETVPHGAAVFDEFVGGQKGVTVEELRVRAQAMQAEFRKAGPEIARATGALFIDPGPKRVERLAEKLIRKGYADAGQITDAARGGFVVRTADEADAIAEQLGRRFTVLDEGWTLNDRGYLDRKLLVRGEDGTIGELQVIPAAMYEAKKGGGQALYKQERSLPEGDAGKLALRDRQREIYATARAALGEGWSGIADTSSGPNLGSKVLRQSVSDMTAAVSDTSELSAAVHAPRGDKTANALPEGVNTAGRQSQLQNVRDIKDNMRSPAAENKAEADLFTSVAVGERSDGSDARFISRDAALAEADRMGFHADLVASCKD